MLGFAGGLQQALGGLQGVLALLGSTLAACPASELPAEVAADLGAQISKAASSVADLSTTLVERIGEGVAGRSVVSHLDICSTSPHNLSCPLRVADYGADALLWWNLVILGLHRAHGEG